MAVLEPVAGVAGGTTAFMVEIPVVAFGVWQR